MGLILWLEEHRKAAWFLTIVYMGMIFFFSSMSKLPQPDVGYDITTLEHIAEYAVLGFLLSTAMRVEKKKVFAVVMIAALYGVTDEIHQFFVPGRVASIYDTTADLIGSAIGAFSVLLLKDKL
jgi:VanZ family protein